MTDFQDARRGASFLSSQGLTLSVTQCVLCLSSLCAHGSVFCRAGLAHAAMVLTARPSGPHSLGGLDPADLAHSPVSPCFWRFLVFRASLTGSCFFGKLAFPSLRMSRSLGGWLVLTRGKNALSRFFIRFFFLSFLSCLHSRFCFVYLSSAAGLLFLFLNLNLLFWGQVPFKPPPCLFLLDLGWIKLGG